MNICQRSRVKKSSLTIWTLYYLLIETNDLYKEICADVEKWFHTSNYDKRRRKISNYLSKKNKK